MNKFLVSLNTLKSVYEDAPEVYHMLLQVLHDYTPSGGQSHFEKVRNFICTLIFKGSENSVTSTN